MWNLLCTQTLHYRVFACISRVLDIVFYWSKNETRMRHMGHEEDNKRCVTHKVGLRINTPGWKFMVTVERRATDMFIRCVCGGVWVRGGEWEAGTVAWPPGGVESQQKDASLKLPAHLAARRPCLRCQYAE